MVKQIVSLLLLFSTLGILLSRELLFRIGVAPNYLYICSGAMVIAALLFFRGALLIILVGLMILAVNLPDAVLLDYGLDKDVLLAVLLGMIIFPLVHRLVTS